MWRRLFSVARTLVGRRRFERDMDAEMRFHVEQYAADLVRSSVPEVEALRRARMEFGGVEGVKDDCRQATGLHVFDQLRRNVGQAVRRLRRTPGFGVAAVVTLGLCLGANLAIFAVVDGILVRPLPFPEPDRVVEVYNSYPKAGVFDDGCSLPNYYERRGRIPAFASMAAYRTDTAVVGDAGSTEQEDVLRVSPEFFATLGVRLARGRGFVEAETTYLTDHVVVVTDAYWRTRLGGDPAMIGRSLRVDGLEMKVVGVLPAGFRFLSSTARLYFPLSSSPEERVPTRRHSGGGTRRMIARLAAGASLATAQAQIDAHDAAMAADDPMGPMMADAGFRSLVVPLRAKHVAAIRPTLMLLQAGALFLLLIGAVNVANLLLIRACGRVKELAVRQAIGASRRHVVSEVMTETLLQTLGGGLLGLAVGGAALRLLPWLGADRLPLGAQVAFDVRLALVAMAGSLALGVALGVPMAWYNLRSHSALALRSESRGATAGRAAQRLRHAFLVVQVALSFVLLAGAGLLGISLRRVAATSAGFRPDGVLSGLVVTTVKSYPGPAARLTLSERLVEALRRQPGVSAAGVATNLPFSGRDGKSAAKVKGYTPPPGESTRGHYSYAVGGDYFAALGFSLREGRWLSPADPRGAGRVCVVDDAFARHYWPGRSAVGQRLFWGSQEGSDAEAFTVVGVVAAAKQSELSETQGQGAVYYPYGFGPGSADVYLVARTRQQPESLAVAMRSAVRAVDPELPLSDVRTMDVRIADSLAARRSPALLAALFSSVAVLLTAVGTYGVLSYAVARRRREIALRMALGARPAQVRRQFLGVALRLLAVGLVCGLGGAWLVGRAMQAVLFQVPALHTFTLVGTAAVVGVVSLAACLLPSWRAARVAPLEALAEE